MLAAFGGGIVAILEAGSGLRAVPWLEGTWRLAPTSAAEASETGPKWLRIEQSGRSLRVQTENGLRLVGRADMEVADGSGTSGTRVRLALHSSEWTLVAEGENGANEFSFELAGPRHYAFSGIREPESPP